MGEVSDDMVTLLRKLLQLDLAVDLGSATTRVSSAFSHCTFEAPSAVGETRALRGGAVVEPECAAEVLRPLFAKVRRLGLVRPRVIASVPTDASREEQLVLEEAVRRAGAAAVELVPEPLAAAVGERLDLGLPYAQLVIDVGHGVTDCAVIRSGLLVESRALRIGCGDLEEALADALAPMDSILGFIEGFVRELPHEIGAEVVESGIHLTGGGALLPGLAEALGHRTGLCVRRFRDPLGAVVLGGRRMAESYCRPQKPRGRRPWAARVSS